MPIHCPIQFRRLTSDDFRPLDYQITGVAMKVHQDLGCHWNEQTYEQEMKFRLAKHSSFQAQTQLPITTTFRKFTKTWRIDLAINDSAIYELKTVSKITHNHIGQVLNYLRMLNATRAKIISFRPYTLETKFVNSSATTAELHRFELNTKEYRGPKYFVTLVEEMLHDFGVGLSNSLYNECLTANLGGILQLAIGSKPNVAENFQIIESGHAFIWTALSHHLKQNREHLIRMQRFAQLDSLTWINMHESIVTVETLA